MSVPFLLIDGYNMLHAAGLARAHYGPGDLARQRMVLLSKLARRLTVEERKRCTVVFDAVDAPPDLPGRFRHGEMTILFAERGHEADELIESLIRQHSAPRRLMVVSSDHRLQTAVRKRRGTAVDSDVFVYRLDSPSRHIFSSESSDSPGAETDLKFWMEEFKGVRPDSLRKELLEESVEPKSEWDRRIQGLQQLVQNPDELSEWLNEPLTPPKNED